MDKSSALKRIWWVIRVLQDEERYAESVGARGLEVDGEQLVRQLQLAVDELVGDGPETKTK